MSPSTITQVTALTAEEHQHITQLAAQASAQDGVAALNEESHFALDRLREGPNADESARVWVARVDEDIVGVLVDASGDGQGADAVVAPQHRRQGVGGQLVEAFVTSQPDAAPAPALWAHGNLQVAQTFLAEHSFEPVRSLWKMSRPLTADESFDTTLPDGFVAKPFDGSSEQAQEWLAVNALAFAYHPEQGSMTMSDFQARTREEWFDPQGLILVWDVTGPVPVLAASHWVKIEPGSQTGEVYVVAVSPSYQGRGLARGLTALGLRQLQRSGATTVELYVEGDNEPAKATYFRAGFTQSAHDAMYRLANQEKSATRA